MSPVENVNQLPTNATMKRENLVKDNKNLNSIFEKYDTNKNGVLDSDEINKALDDFERMQNENKKELIKEGYSRSEIKDLKKFMTNFFKEFKKDVYLNGEINYSYQGTSGDCWLLSGINALSYTDEGKEAIKKCISEDENGNITIELKGVGRKYTFSKQELLDNQNSTNCRATGDYDLKAIEFAFKKYRTELMSETKNNPDRNGSIQTYIGDASSKDPNSGGESGVAIFILTGRKSDSYYKSGTMEDYKRNVADGKIKGKDLYPIDIKETDLTPEDVANYLDKMTKEPNRYAVTCTFDKNYVKEHGYSIKAVTDDYVIVVNPWDSSKEIQIPKDKFMKCISSFSITDMNKEKESEGK